MNKYLPFACTTCALLLTVATVSAQPKSKTNILQPPPADVKVDGDLKEWADSLRYFNEEKKLNYTLANDKDNLYIAFRLNDRTEQARVLGAGLTVSIDTKGKKKASYSLTFPMAEAGEKPNMQMMRKPGEENVTQEDRDALMRARLTKLREIKVVGFKDIEGDVITTTNTYGIKAAINYDANGYLVYEASVPLKFFGEYKADKDQWAFNFKINGLSKPENGGGQRGGSPGMGGMGGGMGGGGMRGGGMGGGRRGGGGMRGGGGAPGGGESAAADRTELFKSVDFWEKFYLNI
ncbi:hypothetical protein HQ865_18050 [Mucilaginibacter mali]|uniref:Uncharacterized protein n=1 Tax=Mucilaginibacter mali TaxID=2740462 RepID=A0A7D4QBE8_9SPHI|nr:hypothetical protein [Mucilaginibacter mali]QKJ31585.1 hypothetical protein HQ865_18050 [Mucilaginibacter mali]